jgi:hypothetical protein
VHAVAVGEETGRLELHVFDDLPHGHTSAATLRGHRYETQVVPCRRLDELLPHAPVLVKVDVEGLEPEVVASASGLMSVDSGPIWIIEVNAETAAAFGRRPHAALAPLANRAYSVFRIGSGGFVPEEAPASAPHGATWLCVPAHHADRLPGI